MSQEMIRKLALLCVLVAGVAVVFAPRGCTSEELYRKRFDPPRVDFMHANMVKSGIASATMGQDNFLTLYVSPIGGPESQYRADGFSYALLLPAFVQMLDKEERGLVVTDIKLRGKPYKRIDRRLDEVQVRQRCIRATYGIEETLWFRVKDEGIPADPQPIHIILYYDGKMCGRSEARLRVYEPLKPPPPVAASRFKFYLHAGARYRLGHYDELADTLRKVGFNSVLLPSWQPEAIKAMKERGFYTIAQRGGSYSKIYSELKECLSEGPKWFAKYDGGEMEKALPHADAVLWDFEPNPGNFTYLAFDDWSIQQFRKAANIADDVKLAEDIVKARYLDQWIEVRQRQLATAVKYWAEFNRSINPRIQTIVTEGRANRFNPAEQIDYRNYAGQVDFCDPMNCNMREAVCGLRKWMARVPEGKFLGCQNLANPGETILYGPKISMLQVLSSALIGCNGNSIFPGRSMDASDFIVYNRVMGFLGRNQTMIFEGQADPEGVTLVPSLEKYAVHRVYSSDAGNNWLVVVCNWNGKADCDVALKIQNLDGKWLLVDEENRDVFTLNGQPAIPAAVLAKGIRFKVPSLDYRGFLIRRYSEEKRPRANGFRSVELSEITKKGGA